MRNLLYVSVLSTLLSGCGASVATFRAYNPVIEDRVGAFGESDIGIIATTASRRAITFRDVPEDSALRAEISVEFCPEPPPDATDEVIRDLTAKLSAQIEATEISAAELREYVKISSDLIFTRTQGVQLFRDGMYNICILHMNRVLDTQQANNLIDTLLDDSVELIKLEVGNGKVIDGQATVSQTVANASP